MVETPDAVEIVRRRLADGRTIADYDVQHLVAEIDQLRQDLAEMQDELDTARRLLGLSPAPLVI